MNTKLCRQPGRQTHEHMDGDVEDRLVCKCIHTQMKRNNIDSQIQRGMYRYNVFKRADTEMDIYIHRQTDEWEGWMERWLDRCMNR